jgi:hypothetical protein
MTLGYVATLALCTGLVVLGCGAAAGLATVVDQGSVWSAVVGAVCFFLVAALSFGGALWVGIKLSELER